MLLVGEKSDKYQFQGKWKDNKSGRVVRIKSRINLRKRKWKEEKKIDSRLVGFFLVLDWGKKTNLDIVHSLTQSKRKEGKRKFGPRRRR